MYACMYVCMHVCMYVCNVTYNAMQYNVLYCIVIVPYCNVMQCNATQRNVCLSGCLSVNPCPIRWQSPYNPILAITSIRVVIEPLQSSGLSQKSQIPRNLQPNQANPKSENKKGKKKDQKKNQKASFRRGHGRAPASSVAKRPSVPEAAPADGHGAGAASPAT